MPIIGGGSSGSGGGSTAPGFEIGYDQITAPVTVVSTTEATPTTIITCAAHTFDGAAVLLTVGGGYLQLTSAGNDTLILSLFESTTEISRLGLTVNPNTTNAENVTPTFVFRFTPTAAVHSYLICAHKSGGTMIVGAGTGSGAAYSPFYARFTKV